MQRGAVPGALRTVGVGGVVHLHALLRRRRHTGPHYALRAAGTRGRRLRVRHPDGGAAVRSGRLPGGLCRPLELRIAVQRHVRRRRDGEGLHRQNRGRVRRQKVHAQGHHYDHNVRPWTMPGGLLLQRVRRLGRVLHQLRLRHPDSHAHHPHLHQRAGLRVPHHHGDPHLPRLRRLRLRLRADRLVGIWRVRPHLRRDWAEASHARGVEAGAGRRRAVLQLRQVRARALQHARLSHRLRAVAMELLVGRRLRGLRLLRQGHADAT